MTPWPDSTIEAAARAMLRAEKGREAALAYWTNPCTGASIYLKMARAALSTIDLAGVRAELACAAIAALRPELTPPAPDPRDAEIVRLREALTKLHSATVALVPVELSDVVANLCGSEAMTRLLRAEAAARAALATAAATGGEV